MKCSSLNAEEVEAWKDEVECLAYQIAADDTTLYFSDGDNRDINSNALEEAYEMMTEFQPVDDL